MVDPAQDLTRCQIIGGVLIQAFIENGQLGRIILHIARVAGAGAVALIVMGVVTLEVRVAAAAAAAVVVAAVVSVGIWCISIQIGRIRLCLVDVKRLGVQNGAGIEPGWNVLERLQLATGRGIGRVGCGLRCCGVLVV